MSKLEQWFDLDLNHAPCRSPLASNRSSHTAIPAKQPAGPDASADRRAGAAATAPPRRGGVAAAAAAAAASAAATAAAAGLGSSSRGGRGGASGGPAAASGGPLPRGSCSSLAGEPRASVTVGYSSGTEARRGGAAATAAGAGERAVGAAGADRGGQGGQRSSLRGPALPAQLLSQTGEALVVGLVQQAAWHYHIADPTVIAWLQVRLRCINTNHQPDDVPQYRCDTPSAGPDLFWSMPLFS